MTSGFIKPHLAPFCREYDGRGKSGQTRPDNMYKAACRPGFHKRPWRNASHNFKLFDNATCAMGSRHPRRNSSRKVAP